MNQGNDPAFHRTVDHGDSGMTFMAKLRTDGDMQVKDLHGNPIAGLFAGGEAVRLIATSTGLAKGMCTASSLALRYTNS